MTTRGWTAVPLPSTYNRIEMISWCSEHFGMPGFLLDRRWAPLDYTIQFKNQEDAVWFKLKWMS